MNRRQFFELGAGACASAIAGTACLGVPGTEALASVRSLATELYDSFDDATRNQVCVAYDHPLRQYHNRGVGLGGVAIGLSNFSWSQLEVLNRLFYSGLSEEGRGILPGQQFLQFLGVRTLRLLMAGDPRAPHFQVVLSGPHMNLRLGGESREGVAFGGPIVYGDQHGDSRQGLPGNVYQYQFHQGQELFDGLSPEQKKRALLAKAPIQTQIELLGDGGHFPGIPVKELSTKNKQYAETLVRDILKVYAREDVAYAWKCLEKNGGVESLHLSYYADGEVDGSGHYQIFRLEGPSAVFYFRGFPHVHAFINVGMDGNAPLSVGEELGVNETIVEGASLCAFFERVMRASCETDFAYYSPESAVGRLRTGVIRTGDIYNLVSWNNTVHIVKLRGSQLEGQLMKSRAKHIERDRTYTLATTNFVIEEELDRVFGGGKVSDPHLRLRDVTIQYVQRNGFV